MKISELIKKLQEIQKEHGDRDIGVLAVHDAFGTGKFIPLKEDGISFVRFNKSKNVLYIDW